LHDLTPIERDPEEWLMDPQLIRWYDERYLHPLQAKYFYNFDLVSFTFFDISWLSYLNLSYLIFLIGIAGILFNYKNFLITMLSIELMYLGIVTSLTIISVFTFDPLGQLYALTILILAASESAIGLGILIVLFRYGNSIEFDHYQELKG